MTTLLPNLGGEEGPGWRQGLEDPTVAATARLWRLLFAPDAKLLRMDEPGPWPEDLGPPPAGPAWPWLDAEGVVVPWVATEDAAADRRVSGRPLWGPPPATVARVHDKAFAHAVAKEERLLPASLRGRIAVFDPEDLAPADAAIARIQDALADWPDWARARFTLKPRIGTSGRGRVAGRDGVADTEALRGALPRLAERGGALLEPWLERSYDLSVQMLVDAEAGVTLLGTLEQVAAPSGRFLGHRGEIDSRGRVFSGRPEEEDLRASAPLVAVAAREAGFHGPCSVDAFVFLDPETDGETLRPIVELNARFTAGTVTVGLVRRALPRVKQTLGLGPGQRMGFHLCLDPGASDAPPLEATAERLGSGACLVRLTSDASPVRPLLLFTADPAEAP